jgi:lipopolysaccharide transport system ATP-binding protein
MSDSEAAIRVENLGKKYRLGLTHAGSIREVLNRMSARVKRVLRPGLSLTPDPSHLSPACPLTTDNGQRATDNSEFWALNDVSFDVRRGEVLGIIGRNGAGKSTLLKILSRVTKPTTGRAEIFGRVGSLLEVGTGFHAELTGRENVYLNGSILGMTKREIDLKFDEIVDFAGVGQFIDTPVKRYSSGMHVRLGFAVAAHLEPEILVIDEVLAVGDADFQKKCLNKMEDVSTHGRTVLIVSHNMGSITALCARAILLERGRIAAMGGASQVVMQYLGRGEESPTVVDFTRDGRRVGDEFATLRRAWVEDVAGRPIHEVDIREPFRVRMEYNLHTQTPSSPYANIHVFDQRGEYVFVTASRDYAVGGDRPGTYQAECCIPGNLLNDGCYFLGLALTFTHKGLHVSFWERDALSISVRDPVLDTVDSLRLGYVGPMPGPVRPQLQWKIDKVA